ncbi:MAG: B12-binding domain-containing radical SAM protein [Promethearchaeota archaeon]
MPISTRNLDVLFINPGTELKSRGTWNRDPPVGILYLIAVLEKYGIGVQILDATLDGLPINKALEAISTPKIVGFTSLTNNIDDILEICRDVQDFYKSRRSKRPVFILGGVHATFEYSAVLKSKLIDFCFIGESEGSICLFTEKVLNAEDISDLKKELIQSLDQKLNIAFLDEKNNRVVVNSNHVSVPDINILPHPARYCCPINKPNHRYSVATVIVNRGCPNKCIFCSRQALFKIPRWRDPSDVVKEIKEIHDAGFYKYYNMYDNLTVSRAFFKKLLNRMSQEKDLYLPWGAELRIDMIDEDSALLMKKTNCKLVATGIESANEDILEIAGKYQKIKDIKRGISILKKHSIPIQAYFIIGLPGETIETFTETIEFIRESGLEPGVDKIDFFAATPYPGSALREQHEYLGIDIFDANYRNYDCQHLVCKPNTLTLKDLKKIWREAKNFEMAFNSHANIKKK